MVLQTQAQPSLRQLGYELDIKRGGDVVCTPHTWTWERRVSRNVELERRLGKLDPQRQANLEQDMHRVLVPRIGDGESLIDQCAAGATAMVCRIGDFFDATEVGRAGDVLQVVTVAAVGFDVEVEADVTSLPA